MTFIFSRDLHYPCIFASFAGSGSGHWTANASASRRDIIVKLASRPCEDTVSGIVVTISFTFPYC